MGIFCIYAVLVLLFHDFLQPATILSALPLALGGALTALWITQQAFSTPAVIGGLISSTVLSPFVVPVVFTYVDDVLQGWRNVISRLRARALT